MTRIYAMLGYSSPENRGGIKIKQAADVLMDHYLAEADKGRKHKYGQCMKDVCMVKIEIESMTGKQTLPEQSG